MSDGINIYLGAFLLLSTPACFVALSYLALRCPNVQRLKTLYHLLYHETSIYGIFLTLHGPRTTILAPLIPEAPKPSSFPPPEIRLQWHCWRMRYPVTESAQLPDMVTMTDRMGTISTTASGNLEEGDSGTSIVCPTLDDILWTERSNTTVQLYCAVQYCTK